MGASIGYIYSNNKVHGDEAYSNAVHKMAIKADILEICWDWLTAHKIESLNGNVLQIGWICFGAGGIEDRVSKDGSGHFHNVYVICHIQKRVNLI